MKNILDVLFLLCLIPLAKAQPLNEEALTKAMHDELQRNYLQLKLANFGTPFFLSYTVGVRTPYEITASLGAITRNNQVAQRISGSINLLLGKQNFTSDVSYNNQGDPVDLPDSGDYNEFRRTFWLATDMAYKKVLKSMTAKQAYLKANPPSPTDAHLGDFSAAPSKSHLSPMPEYRWYQAEMERLATELSKVFLSYPRLFNSSVSVTAQQMTIYTETSEAITLRESSNFVRLSALASVIARDVVQISDSWTYLVDLPQNLLSPDELKKKLTAFADRLLHLSDVNPFAEYYSGPVLFEDAAAMELFSETLLQPGYITAYRKPEGAKPQAALDGRIGRKVIDSRLTVKNYSSLASYNNTRLLGAYSIDAYGVEPAKEKTIIEDGILLSQLNGRIPAPKAPVSTGSSRFSLASNPVQFITAPGTVHVSLKKRLKPEKMKKALLNAAREEGLDYGYIIRKMNGQASLVYRVDVKTGEETQVRSGELTSLNLAKLKRIREISTKEQVANYLFDHKVLSSVIYPSALLIDDIEMLVPQLRIGKPAALTFPLQR